MAKRKKKSRGRLSIIEKAVGGEDQRRRGKNGWKRTRGDSAGRDDNEIDSISLRRLNKKGTKNERGREMRGRLFA